MTLLAELQSLDINQFTIALVSNTAKISNENRLLPFPTIAGQKALNIKITDERLAQDVFAYLDAYIPFCFVDIEKKQPIPLWHIATMVCKHMKLLPYKPNDLTKEAAVQLIYQHFNEQISDQKILICGSGNIATKLALCLAEHQYCVYLSGRNPVKLQLLTETLNTILPAHTKHRIAVYSQEKKYNAFITALSTENSIDEQFISCLSNQALVVDIGINNLTQAFIQKAQEKKLSVFRLDIRAASPLLDAWFAMYTAPFYNTHAGSSVLLGIPCVSGGIVGAQGAIILDTIVNPTKILGIANGTGGVKSNNEYTTEDLENIKKITAVLPPSWNPSIEY